MDACVGSVSDGSEEGGDLIEEVYEYMTQRRYPLGKWKTLKCGNRSTEVRRKAAYRCLVPY